MFYYYELTMSNFVMAAQGLIQDDRQLTRLSQNISINNQAKCQF